MTFKYLSMSIIYYVLVIMNQKKYVVQDFKTEKEMKRKEKKITFFACNNLVSILTIINNIVSVEFCL